MKRSNSWFLTVGVAALLAAGCSDDTTSAAVPTYLVLSSPSTTVVVGDTVRVSAVVQDENYNTLSEEGVSYTSSDASLATVDGAGLVTALAAGPVTISGSDGNAKGTLALTISPPAETADPGESAGG